MPSSVQLACDHLTRAECGPSRRQRPSSRIASQGRRATAILAGWLCVGGVGCAAPEPAGVAVSASPIIHGDDDRVEAFAVGDDDLRERAQTNAVAITVRDRLIVREGAVELDPPSLGMAANLCGDEPFVDQPTLALCSGLLVEPDLVLTAGHCTHMIPCEQMRLVIGYYYEGEGVLAPIDGDDVYECSEVIASERSPRPRTSGSTTPGSVWTVRSTTGSIDRSRSATSRAGSGSTSRSRCSDIRAGSRSRSTPAAR